MAGNFVHWSQLVRKHNVRVYDTSCGKDVTAIVRKSGIRVYRLAPNNFENVKVPFQCHINIRKAGTFVYKQKPATKLSTAAALGCNMITTRDSAIATLLPKDYPYFCSSHDLKSVLSVMALVRKTYNTELWSKGLQMMKKVKEETSLPTVGEKYIAVIECLI